jgi:3'-phosphoadenosine 5'-phosphosulfate sulfotransferase (PAPS reductase)/FAD synthetase
VLNLLGLRAAESALRSKAGFKDKGKKWTNEERRVTHEWLPIQFYSDADVWDAIRTACLPYHSAYEVGFGRLSCTICPLAGDRDLMLGMLVYPDITERMIELENRYDFKWKEKRSARQLLAKAKKDKSLVEKANKARAQLHRPGGPRMFALQTTQGPGKGVVYTPSGTRKARVTHFRAPKKTPKKTSSQEDLERDLRQMLGLT